MQVKIYDYDASKCYCSTPCPFRQEVKIGSTTCSKCKHLLGRSAEKGIVVCGHPTRQTDWWAVLLMALSIGATLVVLLLTV